MYAPTGLGGDSDESDPAMNTPPSGGAEQDSTEAVTVPHTFAPDPAAWSAAQEREDRRFATTGERRFARDGKPYTYLEFLRWYGARRVQKEWEAAPSSPPH